MSLRQHLSEKKQLIIERWIAAVHGTYPFGTIGFLRTQQNPFVNPVGERTRLAAEAVVEVLLAGKSLSEEEQGELTAVLDEFMRVRAIQDFSAEAAVGVFFALKQIVREALEDCPGWPGAANKSASKAAGNAGAGEATVGKDFVGGLLAIESDVDALAMLAFGSYARHRDTLADLRVKEFKRRHSQIIRRAERTLGEDLSDYK
ncbi:RsbRD N-terminal domain-containing protein [Desulfovibrio sp. OttesenSCG-928-C06]|nr:RsbRD N-terminal domain-containing protein [Desulfovibrio sp. OttesenSCG-928-C06]